MAPIKFEEQIKDKLEQRTIQPSGAAWSQLSEKLDTQEKNSSRRLFFYIGIAASLVGILLVSTFIFNTPEDKSIVPIVVETEQKTRDKRTPNAETKTPVPKSSVAITTSEEVEDEKKRVNASTAIKTSIKDEPIIAEVSTEAVNIEKVNKTNVLIEDQVDLVIQQSTATAVSNDNGNFIEKVKPASVLTFEEMKASQVVAEIEKLEIENGAVSDIEIENLLKQAEKEILKNRIFNETTRTVDADALLQDVEQDLETSFRTKVFESLKSSYKTVKTAVAERNN